MSKKMIRIHIRNLRKYPAYFRNEDALVFFPSKKARFFNLKANVITRCKIRADPDLHRTLVRMSA